MFVCVSNAGYEASLEHRKIYPALPDADASEAGLVRVVEESGEEYLLPGKLSWPITLPAGVPRALRGTRGVRE